MKLYFPRKLNQRDSELSIIDRAETSGIKQLEKFTFQTKGKDTGQQMESVSQAIH